MDADRIRKRLAELNFDREQYRVSTGAAMVLYGIRLETADIDLGCTSALADALEKEYPVTVLADGTRKFVLGGDVETFENWCAGETEELDGIPVVSPEGLITVKTALGREKDRRDIALIREYIANRAE